MFNMENVGRNIAELRRRCNMTQMELADKMGISFQAVSNWERGNSMPDISKLPELAEVFDVTIDYLVTGEPCSPKDLKGICTMIKRGVRKVGTAYADSVGQMPANYRLIAEFYHHIAG